MLRDCVIPTPISPMASNISPGPIAPPAAMMPAPCIIIRPATTKPPGDSGNDQASSRAEFAPPTSAEFRLAGADAPQSGHSRVDSSAYWPTLTPFRGELRAGAEIPQALAGFGQGSAVTL